MEFSRSRGTLALRGILFYAVWLGGLLRVSRAVVYTNAWAVRLRAGEEAAERMAEKHGLTNLGQVGCGGEGLDRSDICRDVPLDPFSPKKLERDESHVVGSV